MKVYRVYFINGKMILISAENKTEAQLMAENEAERIKTNVKKVEVRREMYE